jgi:hypothetical protein
MVRPISNVGAKAGAKLCGQSTVARPCRVVGVGIGRWKMRRAAPRRAVSSPHPLPSTTTMAITKIHARQVRSTLYTIYECAERR